MLVTGLQSSASLSSLLWETFQDCPSIPNPTPTSTFTPRKGQSRGKKAGWAGHPLDAPSPFLPVDPQVKKCILFSCAAFQKGWTLRSVANKKLPGCSS